MIALAGWQTDFDQSYFHDGRESVHIREQKIFGI